MSTETSNEEAQFNNYTDRCDRCSAQGQKKVTKADWELTFCNHHFNKHADVLITNGWAVTKRVEPVMAESPELVDA